MSSGITHQEWLRIQALQSVQGAMRFPARVTMEVSISSDTPCAPSSAMRRA